jgi:hypothetical protein
MSMTEGINMSMNATETPDGVIMTMVTLDLRSDSSTVLVAAALLDDRLEKLLLMKMRTLSSTKRKRLFEGCLESFAAKIEVAYAFGLLDDDVRHDLVVIKDIRNDFAHSLATMTFASPEIVARVKTLKGWNTGVSDSFKFFDDRVLCHLAQIDGRLDRRVFEPPSDDVSDCD